MTLNASSNTQTRGQAVAKATTNLMLFLKPVNGLLRPGFFGGSRALKSSLLFGMGYFALS